MKNKLRYFAWAPSSQSSLAFLAGFGSVALSLAMLPLSSQPIAEALVRDFLQVFLVGILLPLAFLIRTGQSHQEFGFHIRRWPLFMAINLILAGGLLFQFRRASPLPITFEWSAHTLWLAAYVLVALVFELVFFYGFLRTLFERAFGIVPSIALVALFYSFHHAGFQPEFLKLFFVGVLYATVFRLGNSALLIFPFFLGVGGLYDVLVQSRVVATVRFPEWRTIGLVVCMALAFAWYWRSEITHRGPAA
jgi:membrane protease YdiL (CAAX protease family)